MTIRRALRPLTGLAVLALACASAAHAQRPGGPTGPVPVSAAIAQREDVPVFLRGLGTAQAYRAVTIRARVDGAIDTINFTEGQEVKPGDLLVQLDPRPYQAALDQAVARKSANEALLEAAKADLERYTHLARTEAASRQRLDNIRALAAQLTAAIQGDDAAIAAARLNLDYTRITAPIEGRVGLKQVDQGNFVRQAESQAIVTITQQRPIAVLFTLPQDTLPRVTAAMARGEVKVLAFASDDATPLADGTLLTPDNAIDTATGTIRLKAIFPNASLKLWPGQFVHARLLVETKPGATVVPSVAVQRGQSGLFVYVVQPDATVAKRDVEIGADTGKEVIVTSGVKDGEQVVTGGHSRLAPGAKVTVTSAPAAPAAEGAPGKASGS
jgi:multidrug efflux system membrane fusion protein